jgi:membrane-associated phospholipid phosphatase
LARRRPLPRRAALAAAAIGAAAPLVRHRLKLPKPVTSALVWQVPVSLAIAVPRSRLRDAALYGMQMWAYYAHYEMPNDDPGQLLRRVRVGYPIAVDRVIGLGEIPTVRLQRALGRPGRVRRHDTFLSWIHWLWFFFPHTTMVYVLLRHRERFGRSATLVAGTFDAGLFVYWTVPTAPPWWARRESKDAPVRRIMVEAGEQFWGTRWGPLYDSLGGNPFAAMPSLHFATSVTAARVLTDTGRVAGALGWTYAATLGFALVYLGEHYVIDLIAGLALAEAVRRGEPRLEPTLRRIQRSLQTLEPRRT